MTSLWNELLHVTSSVNEMALYSLSGAKMMSPLQLMMVAAKQTLPASYHVGGGGVQDLTS